MQELIHIQSQPAILSVNFDELKKHLATQLEKYDVVVTADTVKDAKALATELNATKKIIDTRRKDEVAKASEPVKQFDNNMKELVNMCEQGRQKLLAQVQRFENETRELAKNLLMEYLLESWEKLRVNAEFRRARIDDLAIVTAVTGKGALALSAKRSVDERVMADKALQDQTDRRLLLLENQSLRAGLASPLTRDHVNSFLFQPDDVYQAQLDRIIESEIRRQQEAEARLREKIERENAQAAQAKIAEAENARSAQQHRLVEEDLKNETAAHNLNSLLDKQDFTSPVLRENMNDSVQVTPKQDLASNSNTQENTVTCFIVCSFELQVDVRAPEEVIRKKFTDKIQEAGFKSLVSVRVQKQRNAA